jgi:hypothetical protein
MARQRRRGGFSPPELRGTLGTLLRTTLQQAGVVREALERGAREGRSRLGDLTSDLRSSRRRTEALAELGEIVLELVRRGEIDVEELPEARNVIEHLEELDAEEAVRDDQRDSSPTVAPPTRKRFDDRGGKEDDGTVSATRWKPPTRRDKPTRVWKPNVDAAAAPDDGLAPPTSPGHKKPRDPERKGGISFGNDADDDDLAAYMHPDDLPPKKTD